MLPSPEKWRRYVRGTTVSYAIVHHFPAGTKDQHEASIAEVLQLCSFRLWEAPVDTSRFIRIMFINN